MKVKINITSFVSRGYEEDGAQPREATREHNWNLEVQSEDGDTPEELARTALVIDRLLAQGDTGESHEQD